MDVQVGERLTPSVGTAAIPARPRPVPSATVTSRGRVGMVRPAAQRRFFPRHDQSDRARPTLSGTPWVDSVGDDDVLKLLFRNGLAFRSITKIANTSSKGYSLHSDDEPLQEQLRALDRNLDLRAILEQGVALSKGLGLALIGLGWIESAATQADPTMDPMNISGIEYLSVIPKTSIKEIHHDTDKNSENYGEITHYTVLIPEGDEDKEYKLPASRFIHWKNPFIDNRDEGISQLVPAFNYFTALEEITQAAGAIPKRVGSPLPALQYPDDAGKKELSDARGNFKNITWAKQFMYPEGYEFKLHPTNIALDIKPYYELILSLISATLTGSKFALLGAEQGTQSTSTTNLMDWYNFIAGLQKNFIEPILRELIKTLQAAGVLPEGEFRIEWDPLYEMDAKEKAEVQKLEVEALKTLSEAVKNFKELGFKMAVVDGEMTFELEGAYFTVPAVQSAFSFKAATTDPSRVTSDRPAPVPAIPVSWVRAGVTPTGQSLWMPREELDKVYDQWFVDLTDQEQAMTATMVSESIRVQAEFMDFFQTAWDTHMGATLDTSIPAATPATQSEASFFTALAAMTPTQREQFMADLQQYLRTGYRAGIEKTGIAFQNLDDPRLAGSVGDITTLADQAALEAIDVRGAHLAKNVYITNKTQAVKIIREGVDEGHDYSRIKRDVGKWFAKHNGENIPATVGKYLNTVKSDGRKTVMDKLGIDRFEIITAGDDRVRDEHEQAALRTTPLTWSEVQNIVNAYGCRCTYTAVTVLDEARLKYSRELESASPMPEAVM